MTFENLLSKLQKKCESEHFVFYTYEDEDFSQEQIQKNEEHALKVISALELSPAKNRFLYLAVDKNDMTDYAENPNSTGRANLDNNGVVSIFKFHPHEVTHLIVNSAWGRSNPFYEEGLAVLFGWSDKKGEVIWKQEPIKTWVDRFAAEGKDTSFKYIFENFDKLPKDFSYPCAAWHIKQTLDKGGLDKIRRSYLSGERLQ